MMLDMELTKLKKYVTDRKDCLKDKQFTGPQGEPATRYERRCDNERSHKDTIQGLDNPPRKGSARLALSSKWTGHSYCRYAYI